MHEQWNLVYQSQERRPCADRALVLDSLSIPCELLRGPEGYGLVVPAEYTERAKFELWQYEKENEPLKPPRRPPLPQGLEGGPGVMAYILVLLGVAWLAGEGAFGRDWLSAGRVDGESVRDGEWWRLVTALTLHGGARHLLGNIGFGAVFGLLAGRMVGPGVAWLAILVAAAAGNLLNTLLLDPAHRSIGASTAVFAALGLVSAFVWRMKLMAQDRWAWRVGPLVGGVALLAFTGTGDESTDIGAHLAGFLCGIGGGLLLTRAAARLSSPRLQAAAGAGAATLVLLAWTTAFRASAAA